MDGYLAKPIHAHALYETVEALGGEGGAAGVRSQESGIRSQESERVLVAHKAVFDWTAAVNRVGGRKDLLKQMVELFFSECDRLMTEIRASIRVADAPLLRRLAHSLKGSADCFAAEASVSAAERLELIGKHGDLTGADEAFAKLEVEIARLNLALAAHRQ